LEEGESHETHQSSIGIGGRIICHGSDSTRRCRRHLRSLAGCQHQANRFNQHSGPGVGTRTSVEAGLTYFFTREIAGEIGITQAKHDVTSNGANIGTIRITPLNLVMQYHWSMGAPFVPYAGAGINFTKIGGVDLGGVGLDSSSTGGLLQLGANYDLNKQFRLNGDIKKIWLKTDVFSPGGGKLGNLDVNPWTFSLGAAMKF
jgi:outer membrane protein